MINYGHYKQRHKKEKMTSLNDAPKKLLFQNNNSNFSLQFGSFARLLLGIQRAQNQVTATFDYHSSLSPEVTSKE